jgi:hypothetical protein
VSRQKFKPSAPGIQVSSVTSRPNSSLLFPLKSFPVQHSLIILSTLYRMSHKERSVFWEVIVSAILSRKVYMYMCPIPNGFRDRAISLYNSKNVDKKEILRTVSGIYCSSDKVGTVYLV